MCVDDIYEVFCLRFLLSYLWATLIPMAEIEVPQNHQVRVCMFLQFLLQCGEAAPPILCTQLWVIDIVDCEILGLLLLAAKVYYRESTDISCALCDSLCCLIESLVIKEAHPCR